MGNKLRVRHGQQSSSYDTVPTTDHIEALHSSTDRACKTLQEGRAYFCYPQLQNTPKRPFLPPNSGRSKGTDKLPSFRTSRFVSYVSVSVDTFLLRGWIASCIILEEALWLFFLVVTLSRHRTPDGVYTTINKLYHMQPCTWWMKTHRRLASIRIWKAMANYRII